MSYSTTTLMIQNRELPLVKILLFSLMLIPVTTTYIAVYHEILPHVLYPLFKALLVIIPFVVWKYQSLAPTMAMADWFKLPTAKGVLSGLVLASIILCSYFMFFKEMDAGGVTSKLTSLNLLSHYFMAGLFISCVNSGLEEWFWRGFIHGQMNRLQFKSSTMVFCGGLMFGLHHYYTLLPYFSHGVVLLFTFATMVAGAIWSFQRVRGWSLVDCYVGHIFSDIAIIFIGWLMLNN